MCGVFMGSSCALRVSDKLNWTINIPDRKDKKKMSDHEHHGEERNSGIPVISMKDLLSLHDFADYPQRGPDDNIDRFHHHNTSYHLPHLEDNILPTHDHQQSLEEPFDPNFIEDQHHDTHWTRRKKAIRKKRSASRPGLETFKVLQLTDLHFDPYFVPGSRKDCGEPVCCRSSNGPAMTLVTMAGVWGEYSECDTPFFTIENALQRVSEEHSDVSYWLMTGDLPPHDIWEYSRNETIAHIKFSSWLINHYSKDIGVFPVVGNHEAVPINSFAPPDIENREHDPSWLYEAAAVQWSGWLPMEALETFTKGGHYAVRVKPGFRIISVNSNYCARLNPWVLFDPVDPGGQLQWLSNELLAAEQSGDKVHIIGHVPPDHRECTESWLYNYQRLMERFSQTITAQFYGHTHRDEFRVVYATKDTDRTIPVSLQFIAPSVTSYSQTNPAYRVYEVDSRTYEVVDYKTYYFDLVESNANQENKRPKWRLEYQASQVFNTSVITFETMHHVLKQLQTNSSLFQEYFRRFYVQSQANIAMTWDARRQAAILNDHFVTNPFTRQPGSLLPSRQTVFF